VGAFIADMFLHRSTANQQYTDAQNKKISNMQTKMLRSEVLTISGFPYSRVFKSANIASAASPYRNTK
jgi:hypothetical protein